MLLSVANFFFIQSSFPAFSRAKLESLLQCHEDKMKREDFNEAEN